MTVRIYPGQSQPRQLVGDVELTLSGNVGTIMMEGTGPRMTAGFASAVLCSLIGGNESDPGSGDKSRQWWGNVGLPADQQYRSRTGHLLASLAPTSGTLAQLQSAVNADLAYMVQITAASTAEGEASLLRPGVVDLVARVRADGREENFHFAPNWRTQAEELSAVEFPNVGGTNYAYWVDDDADIFIDDLGSFFMLGG